MTDAWNDTEKVVRHYGQRETGRTIFDFRQPELDWYSVVLDHVRWSRGESVLDAGCGGGGYLPALVDRVGPSGAVVGLDLTLPLLVHTARPASPHVGFVNADIVRLPFANASFDKILCAHMLYVVPDIPAAVAELRRVLRPGGTLLALTNSESDKRELDDVFVEAGLSQRLDDLVAARFTRENGAAYLEAAFEFVEVRSDQSSALVVPDAEVIVAWADHWRETAEPLLEPGTSWRMFRENVRRLASERVERDGAFICREHSAVFLCR